MRTFAGDESINAFARGDSQFGTSCARDHANPPAYLWPCWDDVHLARSRLLKTIREVLAQNVALRLKAKVLTLIEKERSQLIEKSVAVEAFDRPERTLPVRGQDARSALRSIAVLGAADGSHETIMNERRPCDVFPLNRRQLV